MSWWQTLVASGGGAGVLGAALRVLRSRKLRRLAADAINPDEVSRVDSTVELRMILEEQRRGYEHLVTRVGRLESDLSRLERALADARKRERDLSRQLREERKLSASRIAELEHQLGEARTRIAALEAQLAEAHGQA